LLFSIFSLIFFNVVWFLLPNLFSSLFYFFVGPDMRALFILVSSSGSILRAKMPFAGRKMYALQDGDQA